MAIKKDLVNLNVKIPVVLKKKIDKHVTDSDHVNTSEFTRDALREKLAREVS
jgi:Arc/MetJ-type ribon-helix-helix transcriptional regulator